MTLEENLRQQIGQGVRENLRALYVSDASLSTPIDPSCVRDRRPTTTQAVRQCGLGTTVSAQTLFRDDRFVRIGRGGHRAQNTSPVGWVSR